MERSLNFEPSPSHCPQTCTALTLLWSLSSLWAVSLLVQNVSVRIMILQRPALGLEHRKCSFPPFKPVIFRELICMYRIAPVHIPVPVMLSGLECPHCPCHCCTGLGWGHPPGSTWKVPTSSARMSRGDTELGTESCPPGLSLPCSLNRLEAAPAEMGLGLRCPSQGNAWNKRLAV